MGRCIAFESLMWGISASKNANPQNASANLRLCLSACTCPEDCACGRHPNLCLPFGSARGPRAEHSESKARSCTSLGLTKASSLSADLPKVERVRSLVPAPSPPACHPAAFKSSLETQIQPGSSNPAFHGPL